jgi:lipid-binding SYLF domain-containing protein
MPLHHTELRMSISRRFALVSIIALGTALPACSNYKESGGESNPNAYLQSSAQRAIDNFKRDDASLQRFFDQAHAYVVFPEIAKGAVGIGAANGEGVVYQNGSVIGFGTMTQVTVGAQIGGQKYSEIVFIQDAPTLDRFKRGETKFAANASAVIAKSGAGASNDYSQGVAVFVRPISGAMAEAAIGGQSFTYRPAH